MVKSVELEVGGRILSLEIGRVAKQADGAVLVKYGETVVLATACVDDGKKEDRGFLPFIVDYRERTSAAGRIPGGWFKREGRPRDKEILSARLIDRPIRPLFPDGFRSETQIVVTVLSSDKENDSDLLGLIGGSISLVLSKVPVTDPIGAVRIGLINDEFIVNPTFSQLEESSLNLVVAGTKEKVTTLEGKALEVQEGVIYDAIELGHEVVRSIVELQERLMEEGSKEKMKFEKTPLPQGLEDSVKSHSLNQIIEVNRIRGKVERQESMENVFQSTWEALKENYPDEDPDRLQSLMNKVLQGLLGREIRKSIVEEGIRPDGRNLHQIRPITCELGVLPRAHGSSLFTRGETQSLCSVTLGTTTDEQKMEELEGESKKTFMLHYNFPPYSVGEVRFLRGPGRREIGHGALAEKALEPVIPSEDDFPYTVRVVSDILESNGSSSMATVCGGSLSLMDAGVPIKTAVAGLSIGLIQEGEKGLLLSDIAGAEDHDGDMDFKVAGTKEGLTVVQLDTKIEGVDLPLLKEAMELAREGREHILGIMNQAIENPRSNISMYAPRVIAIDIPKEKIGAIIGPGGKMIRYIIEQTGAEIEVEDDGKVTIVSTDQEGGEKALKIIQSILEEAEVGKVYTGVVKKITNFGAFVEILPGKEGLVHISNLAPHRVARVEDVVKEGEKIEVKCIGVDSDGKIDLSRKALLGGEESERGRRPPSKPNRPNRFGPRSSSGGRRR